MTRIFAIAAALLAALVTGAAFALAGGDDSLDVPTPGTDDRRAIDALAPDLSSLVSAFRREQQPDDVSVGSDAALANLDDAQPGEDPRLSRRLDLSDGTHAYMWPMADGVCWSA